MKQFFLPVDIQHTQCPSWSDEQTMQRPVVVYTRLHAGGGGLDSGSSDTGYRCRREQQ